VLFESPDLCTNITKTLTGRDFIHDQLHYLKKYSLIAVLFFWGKGDDESAEECAEHGGHSVQVVDATGVVNLQLRTEERLEVNEKFWLLDSICKIGSNEHLGREGNKIMVEFDHRKILLDSDNYHN